MLKKFIGLPLLVLCLMALAACATTKATPLQQLQGDWVLSFDETLLSSNELRALLEDDPGMEEYMRESMDGLILSVDVERGILVLKFADEADEEVEFSVISESVEENKLEMEMMGEQFVLLIKGDRMEWVEDGDTLVFLRVK